MYSNGQNFYFVKGLSTFFLNISTSSRTGRLADFFVGDIDILFDRSDITHILNVLEHFCDFRDTTGYLMRH